MSFTEGGGEKLPPPYSELACRELVCALHPSLRNLYKEVLKFHYVILSLCPFALSNAPCIPLHYAP